MVANTPDEDDNIVETEAVDRHRVKLVTDADEDYLNQRQRLTYQDHRRDYVEWLLHFAKDPDAAKGYSPTVVRRRSHDHDKWMRWIWSQRGYTLDVTHDDADEYLRHLVKEDYSDTHKDNTRKSLKCYFRWRDDRDEWEPELSWAGSGRNTQPREYLTDEERSQIREAALEYGTIPAWRTLDKAGRLEWKKHLAQRFRKPVEDVDKNDFQRANGFKIPSLVNASLDAGLRPVEVGRAKPSWVDTDNNVLRITEEDSSKNRDNWVVTLREQTATMLDRWLDERALYPKYDDSEHLWLTRQGKPYSSRSLKYLIQRLCEEVGIDTENRKMTWYALRHSTGTYMAREEGLEAAAQQLRHKSVETTRKYDNTPHEDRRDALERMG